MRWVIEVTVMATAVSFHLKSPEKGTGVSQCCPFPKDEGREHYSLSAIGTGPGWPQGSISPAPNFQALHT